MLSPYALKYFAEKLNKIKVDADGITPMVKVSGTTTDIELNNNHIWGRLIYILDARLQDTTGGLPKW